MKKRLLAMLLALMLVVGLLPVGVLADEVPEYYRIKDPQALRTAAITKAGYDPDNLAVGIIPTITTRLYTYDGRYSDANSTLVEGLYYENTSVDATNRGNVIMPDEIDRIRVTVSFTDDDYHRHTESVIFDRSEFNWEYDMDSIADGHDIVWLTLNNESPSTDGHKVEFYFQPIGKADWELYDIVYVDDGECIGSEMPATPDTGEYHFVGWQTERDGSGKALFSDTVITEPWTVYGAKVSAEGGTQYHVMKNSTGGMVNALNAKLAELYGGGVDANSFHITAMRVNDSEGKHTNENYIGNEWKDNTYYLIWNNSAENPADPSADHKNTRILVEDIASLTVYGTIGSTEGEPFEIIILRSELEFQKVSDYIIEIKIRDDKVNEPEPGPDPDVPSDPTEDDLGKLAVVLKCVNEDVEHTGDPKTFNLRTTNCTYDIKQDNGQYICTVTPNYDLILERYNTQVAGGHDYTDVVDKTPTFTMTWNGGWNAATNTITREVACETEDPEPVEYAVNYHIVDANGNVIDSDTDYVNAGEYTDYVLWQPDEQAGCTFSGWFQKIADLEANHAKVTALYADKKWELYGRFTPNEPTAEWLQANVMIQVDCLTLSPSVHGNRDYTLIDGSYGEGTLSARENGGWQYSFTVYAEKYLDAYAEKYGEHTAINSSRTVTLHFTDGEWVNHDPYNNIYAVFDVKCVGPTDIPDADDLAALNVTVKDNSGAIKHGQKSYGLEECCYELPDSFVHDADKGIYTYTITVDYNAYAAKFDKDMGFADGTHTPTLASNKWHKFVFTWTNGEWVVDQNSITVGVKCSVPDTPDVSELVKVTVKDHADGPVPEGADDHGHEVYSLIEDTYTMSEPAVTGDTYTVTVKLTSGEEYAAKYSADKEYKHVLTTTVSPEHNKPSPKTLTYDFATGTWKASDNGFTLGVECVLPHVPTIDDVGGNDFEVNIECIDTDTTPDATYGLLEFDNTYKFEKEDDATYYLVVTADAFLADYNDSNEINHVLADGQSQTETMTLNWDYKNAEWDLTAASVTFNVEADNYTIVYHGNGGATESGAEQRTSNFKYGSEATIKRNTFIYDGYVFEGWALSADGEVVYTGSEKVPFTEENFPGLLENGKFDLYAVWAEDELGDGEDGNEPDGVADYRQVFVKYVAADENGFVTPSFDTFNLEVDETGKVMTNVPLSLSGEATPNADATFAYWTIDGPGYDGGAYSYEDKLSGKYFTGYVAGETYTFTAHFNGPVVKPEQVAYDINVEVVNGTAEFKGTNIGANSVINVYPIKDDNKNVEITFVPTDGYVFDAAYVDDESITLSKDNSYTFKEVTADVTIKVLFKQDSVPITPVTPMPTPGEISDLIKDKVVVDCVNDEMNHGDKAYGLLDDALVRIEKTDDTTVKVTLDATVYQARYNTDTETKHSLADGQSATVTFALNYVDQTWRVAEGELPITIKVVCETPVEPEPDITDFSKTLVKDRNLYVYQGLAYPTFYRGSVIVDEGDGVTLLYKITVKGTPGTEFTVRDDSADFVQTGEIPDSGETSFYVAKAFTWREIRRADELTNTAAVLLDGKVADSDTETVDVDIDWDYNPPVVDDDDDATPNWLNLDDHDAYIQGYPDGRVKPQNNITRAEVATIFYRLLTDDARDYYYSTDSGFSDVKPGDWYNTAVATMVQAGILNGYSDGTFKPNASITRAEFATIAARFLSNPYSTKDRFYDTEGHWAEVYINRAAEIGWIGGYPDGSFKPDRYITRAEAVTLVNNVLGREPHADYMLDDMITWPDNPKSAWYYEDIQEATNSHDYRWSSSKSYEIWTKLL